MIASAVLVPQRSPTSLAGNSRPHAVALVDLDHLPQRSPTSSAGDSVDELGAGEPVDRVATTELDLAGPEQVELAVRRGIDVQVSPQRSLTSSVGNRGRCFVGFDLRDCRSLRAVARSVTGLAACRAWASVVRAGGHLPASLGDVLCSGAMCRLVMLS